MRLSREKAQKKKKGAAASRGKRSLCRETAAPRGNIRFFRKHLPCRETSVSSGKRQLLAETSAPFFLLFHFFAGQAR